MADQILQFQLVGQLICACQQIILWVLIDQQLIANIGIRCTMEPALYYPSEVRRGEYRGLNFICINMSIVGQ